MEDSFWAEELTCMCALDIKAAEEEVNNIEGAEEAFWWINLPFLIDGQMCWNPSM